MAVDFATLGLGIDATASDVGAKKHLDNLSKISSATRSTMDQEKRGYADRLATISQSYRFEIEAAQRAREARLRSSITPAEIEQIRAAYQARAAAAQQAMKAEVEAAAQEVQAFRSVTNGVGEVTKAADRSHITMNTLRSSATTLANTMLGTLTPGVAQLTSALGGMAYGSKTVVAVLLAIAALALAFRGLTKDIREQKEEAERNIDVLRRLAQAKRDAAGGDVTRGIVEAESKLAELNQKRKFYSDIAEKGNAAESAVAAIRLKSIERQISVETDLLKTGYTERQRITKDAIDKNQKTWDDARKKSEEAINAAIRKQEQYVNGLIDQVHIYQDAAGRAVSYAEAITKLHEIYDETNKALSAGNTTLEQRNKLLEAQLHILDEMIAKGVVGSAPKLNGGLRDIPGIATPEIPPPPVFMRGGPSWTSQLGSKISGMLNPETILSGLATGGISTAIGAVSGAVGGFVDKLFDFSGKAAEAARQLKDAEESFIASMKGVVAGLKGDTLGTALAQSEKEYKDFVDQFKISGQSIHGKGGGLSFGAFENSDETLPGFIQSLEYLRDNGKLTADQLRALGLVIEAAKLRLGEYEKALEAQRQKLSDSIAVLALQADGQDTAAAALQREIDKKTELAGVTDEATRALIQQKQALEDAVAARLKEIELAKQLSDFTGNVLGVELANAQRAMEKNPTRSTFTDANGQLGAGGSIGTVDQYLATLHASLEFNNARQLDEAKKLLESGGITQELFDRLRDALGVGLKNALDDAAQAAADAAQKLQESKQAFKDQLTLAELTQGGDQKAVQAFQAKQQAEEWRKQATELGLGQDVLDRISAWLARQLEQITNGAAGGAGAPTHSSRMQDETVRSVTGITETTALRLFDLTRTSNAWLSEIAFNTRALRGGGGPIFQGGVAGRTSNSGRTITVQFNNYGPITAGDGAGANRLGRNIGRGIAQQVNEDLGYLAEQDSKSAGDATR